MNILSIGYGRNLFDSQDGERKRLEHCAKEVTSLHMVIFTLQKDGLSTTQVSEGFYLHPTHSTNRFHMIFDALRIATQLVNNTEGKWVVTAQDPFEAGLVGALVAKRNALPFNVQEHGDVFSGPYWRKDSVLNRIRYVLGRYVLKKAHTVRVVSKRSVATLKNMGIPREKILYLPVRTDSINSESAPVDLRSEYPKNNIFILSLGRMVAQKNLPLLLRSFADLLKVEPQALLVMVGSGPELPKLKRLVEALHIEENIVFKPWTNDPYALMRGADIFALSSNWEGWGRVLIEAMSAGTSVVSTDVGCANEVCMDRQHGFVVPVGDQKAFTEKLITLAQDVSLREQFGRNGERDVAAVHTTLDAYARGWAQVWVDTYTRVG